MVRYYSSNHHRRTITIMNNPLPIIFLAALLFHHPAHADLKNLTELIHRLDSDVIELRNKIESSISTRCDSIRGCDKSSYDECQSLHDSGTQTCPSGADLGYSIQECGQGERCNGIFDYGWTTVRLPPGHNGGPDGNPTNPFVIEAVCYTRTAEKWMVNKYEQDSLYWKSLNVSSPQMYYGASNGMFRIHPARHSRECGQYDPRGRPWYKAAVPTTISTLTKPRHVVIVMDTSRTMGELMKDQPNPESPITKLGYTKTVVKYILGQLSDKDTIAVVRFGERASVVGGIGSVAPYLWKTATPDRINRIMAAVDQIEVTGRSDFIVGFDEAFDIIENSLVSIIANSKDRCKVENTALLFFSDGFYNLPEGTEDDDIVDHVQSRVQQVKDLGDFTMHTFLYSLDNNDVNQALKQVSCSVDGFWKYVSGNMAVSNVTNGYQTLFSTPLGTDRFYNYTTWSEPYVFTSSNEPGYTVSALVYNRGVEPPRFMGAVGMDVGAEAARQVYGGTLEETEAMILEITTNITNTEFNTTCSDSRINLTYCETQSIRHLGGGNDAICFPEFNLRSREDVPANTTADTNTNDTEVIFDVFLNCSKAFMSNCAGMDEYPTNLWKNVDLKDKSYEDRVCCEVGTNAVSDKCPRLDQMNTRLSDGAIFSIIFISLAIAEIFGCYYCFRYKKRNKDDLIE